MLKAVIFDLDGVIVDTAKFHYLAWKRLAHEKFSYNFTEEKNELFKGVNRIRCMEILNELSGAALSEADIINYADIKNEWYKEYVSGMTPDDVLPGALDFIRECKSNGLLISIASASKNTPLVLNRTNLMGLFDAVIDGNCVTKAKPDPEVFLAAAEKCNALPEECIVFEDAQAGIDGAKSAGMKCVGIGDEKILSGADKYVPGLYAVTVDKIKVLF